MQAGDVRVDARVAVHARTERRERSAGGTRGAHVPAAGLAVLYAFTAAALAGYAWFGRSPARLAEQPAWALTIYEKSFSVFALGQVLLAFGVVGVVLVLRAGGRWLPALGAVYGISLSAELAGTTWGLPFGAYSYSELLGPMWFGRVPVVIPLSWFYMAVPSYALVAGVVRSRVASVLAGSLLLLAWDLALDPAMSHVTHYWVWGERGPYYGMPWLNLLGWYLTGLALMGVLSLQGAAVWIRSVPAGWWRGFYGANLLMPLGLCAAAGAWSAVWATIAVLAAGALLLRAARLRSRRRA